MSLQRISGLLGLSPEELGMLQQQRNEAGRQARIEQLSSGYGTSGQQAMARLGAQLGTRLGAGMRGQQQDPDIAQARMMQEATQGIMNSPEFQKMNPFQQRTVLARQAAQTAARLGNPALASQLLSQATAAMKEEADYIASTKPGAAKTPTKIAEIEMAAQALGLPESDPRVQSAYSRLLEGEKAESTVDRKVSYGMRAYGLSRDQATGYALGTIKVETDPQSNRLLITDTLSGETTERPFGARQQAAFQGAVNTGEAAAVEAEPEVILPQTTAILESPRSIMDILSETNITGPVAGVTRIAEKAGDIVSTVFNGKPQPIPTIAANQAFNLWKKDLIDSLRTSVRNAVTEIDVIQKQVKVEPSASKGKTEFMSELSTVAEWLASKHKEYSDFANNPSNPQSERDQDKKSAETIRMSLTKLVGPERVNELLGTGGQGKIIEVDY
jgi:hypothetical protein